MPDACIDITSLILDFLIMRCLIMASARFGITSALSLVVLLTHASQIFAQQVCTNAGTDISCVITGSYNGTNFGPFNGAGSLTVMNNADIVDTNTALTSVATGGVSVTNNGALSGANLWALDAEVLGGSGRISVVNNSSVQSAQGSGIRTFNQGPAQTLPDTIINFGIASGLVGINQVANSTDVITVNYGKVSGSLLGILAQSTGSSTVVNAGTVVGGGAGRFGIQVGYFNQNSPSVLVNSGGILNFGGTAIILATTDNALVLAPGSFIVGNIQLNGTRKAVQVDVGNQNLTFTSLASATVTGSVPVAVVGNRIVSVDPTGFAGAGRTLMDFTRAVSGLLGGRSGDGAAGGGTLGFAADSAVADDVFAQVLGYAQPATGAVWFKNPSLTTADGTTVWAKGFYGQRIQQADGPVLRSVTNFYGGALGLDRQVQGDLRLGAVVGGGNISSSFDLNAGDLRSDIGFGGLYGRKDFGRTFLDFALLGGASSNRATRARINNNLLAGGLETATASYGGWFVSPELAVGVRTELAPGWTVTPAARLRYLAAGFDGFTEAGSTANLTVGSRTSQNVEERGELSVTRTATSELGRLQISFAGGVIGQQRVGDGGINAVVLGQALAFATPGKASLAGGFASASFDWRMRNNASLFAGTEYVAMNDSSGTITGKAGVRIGF
ncbi:autotransporter domain-containing protein [Bradyrhizobium diazoefficiens]|nr:autotransporter outer membrane beta-barrel domain-containing protein [Bradyrhizobium diazoefficiens]MBR0963108.1 autotransporter domain-containing protein [Bradyrhizobium diazoefficiens]MBR0977268.1 autotransporter domain-containing protein [Bradyrhizobium diazoefficiens]MBR1005913.1 autotransporter domain-containing protein [Bradyrhizobium diazoefficiens]MBR1012386.1 autotransporter domain-containing protein [Bradyrhizobium diazoefficiens]MBR1049728.1 autotransporter domain-containing prot